MKTMTSENESEKIYFADRVRRYQVSPHVFPMMFKTGLKLEVTAGVPDGAKFKGYSQDYVRNLIIIFLEHESFDLIPEGQECPDGGLIHMRVIE